jgi:hypothetical protein
VGGVLELVRGDFCPRICTDAHGLDLGCSTQNRRVVDPIVFAWKGFGVLKI